MNLKKITYGLSLTAFISYSLAALIFFSGNVFKAEAKTFEINQVKKVSAEGLQSLKVITTSADIKLKVDDVEKVSVKFTGSVKTNGDFKEPELLVEKKGDELTIKIKRYKKKRFIFINYNYSSNLKLVVVFPKTINKKLLVSSVSGDVEFNKVKFNKVSIDTTSGDILFDSILAKKILLDTVSGDIKGELISGGNFSIESTSGDVLIETVKGLEIICSTVSGCYSFDNVEVTGLVKIDSTSGDYKFGKVVSKNLRGNSISGEIEFNGLKTKVAEIDLVSGDVALGNFSGDLNVSTTSGDVNGTVSGFEKKINISTTSGDISLKMDTTDKFSFNAKSRGGIEYSYNGQSISSEHKLNLNCDMCTKTVSLKSVSGEISLK